MRLPFLSCVCLLFVGCGPTAWDARVSYEGRNERRRDNFASNCEEVYVRDTDIKDGRPIGADNRNDLLNQAASSLVRLIREAQMREVGVSTGEWDYECFTEAHLSTFLQRDVPREVTRRLLNDKEFLAVLSRLRAMPAAEIDLLLQRARQTYRPTWAELGRISPDGQTAAGQRADRLIADAIVDTVVKELRKGSP